MTSLYILLGIFAVAAGVFLTMKTKISKQEKKIKDLTQEVHHKEVQSDVNEAAAETKKEILQEQAENVQEQIELETTIPETKEELSDEAKESAAAITQHLLDRQRKRMSKHTNVK